LTADYAEHTRQERGEDSVMSNSIITAGWFFFAGWSAVLATLSGIAFGRDLFPEKIHTIPTHKKSSTNTTRPVSR